MGAQNDTRVGGGFVASARFPVITKLDLGLHLVAGDGAGRYGAALLPDITVRPNGTWSRCATPRDFSRWNIIRSRNSISLAMQVLSMFSERTTSEVLECSLAMRLPSSTILAVTSKQSPQREPDTLQVRVPALERREHLSNGWTGVGGAPKATNNMVYTSFRYYIP